MRRKKRRRGGEEEEEKKKGPLHTLNVGERVGRRESVRESEETTTPTTMMRCVHGGDGEDGGRMGHKLG